MKVEVYDKTDSEIKFGIEGVKPSFASALRRIMLSEVPTMAIEWVEFKKNDSALPDEIVANRLGLVPLIFEKNGYNLPEECKCEGKGCSNCQVKLTMKKKGPAVVYSGDLKSTAKDVKPVYEKIPITELFEGQEIQFEATAQLGKGRRHAKWQAAIVGYQNKPVVVVTKEAENKTDIAKICPANVFDVKGNKLVAARPEECILCNACVEASDGKVKVEGDENSFTFTAETTSGLKPEEIVSTAAEILENKMSEFSKQIKKLK